MQHSSAAVADLSPLPRPLECNRFCLLENGDAGKGSEPSADCSGSCQLLPEHV